MVKTRKEKSNLKNKKGITLIALVITIIVLLILAGVSIMTLAGDNGLLTRTVGAKNKTTLAGMEEELNLAYMSVYTGKAGSGAINSGVSLDEIYNDASLPSEIKSHIVRLGGVSTVSLVNTDQRNVTILAEDGAITSSGTTGTNTVSIQVEEGSNSYAYWLESEGVYYPMSIANGRVVLDKENISTTEPTGEGSLGSGIEVTFKDSGAAEATSESNFVTKKSTSKSGNITTITLEAAGAGSTEVVVKSGNIGLTGGNISVIVSPVYTLQFGTMTNGDIVITTGGQETGKNAKYASGTQIVLTATGSSGYAFEKWYDNGTENTSVTTASRTIEVGAGTAEITYTATFKVSLGYFKQDGTKAYYYPSQNATAEERIEITNNPADSLASNPSGKKEYVGRYLGMKVNYTPTGAKTVSSTTIGTGKNGSETSPTYRLFYVDVNGDYGEEGTIYLKADDDANNASLSALDAATGTTKMQQFNKKWWADTTKCNNSSYASYNNRISVNKLLDPSKWTEYKDASGENQIADYVVGAPSLEMWIDSYNAFLSANPVSGKSAYNCTVATSSSGTATSNSGAGYFVGVNGAYTNSGWNTDSSTLVNPSSYTGNPTAADRVEAWNKGSRYYWLASPSAGYSDFVMYVYGGGSRVDNGGYSDSRAFCPLVSCNSGVSIQEK